MKRSFKTWQLGLILLLAVVIPASAVIALARAKANNPVLHSQQHTTPEDFWPVSSMPVKVTEVSGQTVYYEFQGSREVKLGSFETEERTIYPAGGLKVGKTYYVTFCPTHTVAYMFEEWKSP